MSKFQETLHTFIDNLPVARSWGWISGLTDKLTSGHFDRSQPSGKNRELRPHSRSDPPRGQQRVRDLGHHKTGEFAYYKR